MANPITQPRSFGTDSGGRHLFSLPLRQLEDFPKLLDLPSQHFGLLLSCDARGIPDLNILKAAGLLLRNGLAYLCTWGPECERVHELFDMAAKELDPHPTTGSTIMITSHEEEALDSVLWFFLNAAFAADDYMATCRTLLTLPVNNNEWTQQIEGRLADPEGPWTDVYETES